MWTSTNGSIPSARHAATSAAKKVFLDLDGVQLAAQKMAKEAVEKEQKHSNSERRTAADRHGEPAIEASECGGGATFSVRKGW